MAKSNRNRTTDVLADVRGAERAAHYAAGGTPQTYRGAARTLDNKTKARASKRACRGRVGRESW